jgi:hypothetical protein
VLTLLVPEHGVPGRASLLDRDTLTGVESMFAMFVIALAIASGS